MITKSKLAIVLSKLKLFENPKSYLEQYPTDSEVAADILWNAYMIGDIENKKVADLGAGTGILGIGALMLGAKVYFVEKDKDAIKTLKQNLEGYENYEISECDVSKFDKKVDTVIMNPPFGIQNRKADKPFVEKAVEIAKNFYYIGIPDSEVFIRNFGQITHKWAYKLKLKKTMKYHSKKSKDIDINCWKISV